MSERSIFEVSHLSPTLYIFVHVIILFGCLVRLQTLYAPLDCKKKKNLILGKNADLCFNVHVMNVLSHSLPMASASFVFRLKPVLAYTLVWRNNATD